MNRMLIEQKLRELGWDDYVIYQKEIDLKQSNSIDLYNNEFGIITDCNIVVEIENPTDTLINPILAVAGRQLVIATELFEGFETSFIQSVDDRLFTYQMKLRRQPLIEGSSSIKGNLLENYSINSLVSKLISGYALVTIIQSKNNV